ncbi:MAG: DNA-(apurinic or apyrimidinic site) lyase / pyrimidine dimer glycosylase [Gammaproteobacteria bacterium]|jgi:hypothetical protein|nr:DNA-(apurinic or apyrimidinic site) lyase / pyrimidine dimer glycosylase [Gammaproteobacteria bacterium]
MRIWSIHPQYLDPKGLVALWREGLLAQNVLRGMTKGYQHHPQLIRFKAHSAPLKALANYLQGVCDEAEKRGYHFNRSKIAHAPASLDTILVSTGQIHYEWQHFLNKIEKRDNLRFKKLKDIKNIEVHPLFTSITGNIENWERIDQGILPSVINLNRSS